MSKLQTASVTHPCYSAKQVLDNEAQIALNKGLTLYELMERAGQCFFTELLKIAGQPAAILVVCGKGNNGGDGFIISRLAHQAGIEVYTLMLCSASELKGDAKTAYQALAKVSKPIEAIDVEHAKSVIAAFEGEVIVDAIFGIGFRGELAEPYLSAVTAINEHVSDCYAVDVPSGVNATTGAVENQAIKARDTISFIVAKQGLVTGRARNYVGQLHLADLALGDSFQADVTPLSYLQYVDNLPKLALRKPTCHKGDIGLLLTIGGNHNMPGAIRLASEAALRSGRIIGKCLLSQKISKICP